MTKNEALLANCSGHFFYPLQPKGVAGYLCHHCGGGVGSVQQVEHLERMSRKRHDAVYENIWK